MNKKKEKLSWYFLFNIERSIELAEDTMQNPSKSRKILVNSENGSKKLISILKKIALLINWTN